MSPYFINTGNFKSGEQFNILGEFYANFIVNENVKYDALFGPAYKGIILVIACSSFLSLKHNINKPFFFNRKEKKDHGEGGNFIGHRPTKNEKIIIIEDVLTAGTAIKETLPIITKTYKITCEDVFILVDRCEFGSSNNIKASTELEQNFNLKIHALINIKDIFEYLKNNKKYETNIKNMQLYIEKYCIF
jgi:orotate phosphoribosyltransferase